MPLWATRLPNQHCGAYPLSCDFSETKKKDWESEILWSCLYGKDICKDPFSMVKWCKMYIILIKTGKEILPMEKNEKNE